MMKVVKVSFYRVRQEENVKPLLEGLCRGCMVMGCKGSIGLTHKLRNHEPQRRREASALGGFPDLKQLARHGEIRV
ncbi:hypothetical protein [uncultured Nostoc sp.]|uniref:hypothetical protein n=1 Tax=uncultured Nostoc sp. TaxID=340711 RepID=UPI0035CC0233